MTPQTYWLRRKKSIFLLIVALMVLAACQAEPSIAPDQAEPSITTEELIGRWQLEEGAGRYIQEIKEDGTFNVGAVDFGTYQLEGALFTFTTSDGTTFCFGGNRGTYEVERTEEGKLHWTLIEDDCRNRSNTLDDSLWSQITP